jgi:hypothetical protein
MPDLDDALSGKASASRRHQAAMVRLGDCGKSLSASAIGAWFGCLMEGRDMVGEFGHQGRI